LQAFMDMFGSYRAKAETGEAGEFINSLLEEIDYENHLMQNEEGKAGEIKWRNVSDLVSWFARKGGEDGKNIIELAQT
ncbi:ATP-dependent DNA helicase Rep, partial [Neisseria meningitidis]|nr:ATP-dependent DNA helicase Rep [Neisseria meningitidis]